MNEKPWTSATCPLCGKEFLVRLGSGIPRHRVPGLLRDGTEDCVNDTLPLDGPPPVSDVETGGRS